MSWLPTRRKHPDSSIRHSGYETCEFLHLGGIQRLACCAITAFAELLVEMCGGQIRSHPEGGKVKAFQRISTEESKRSNACDNRRCTEAITAHHSRI